jgi:dipeptidyl aminopeptidase/acylaminoacyl peptidase
MGLLVAALLVAQAPTIQQALELKTIAAPQISPDGRWIAWTETSTDWDQNAYLTQVWVAQRQTGERWQLTQAKKSSTAPAWSPDSKLIAFGSDRDGKRQIYLIAPAGGEARAITASETPVGDFRWSPDGKSIAYTAPEAESKAKKDRKDTYGEFEVVENDYTNAALWIVPVAEGNPKADQLTKPADFHVLGFDWSPDGSAL